MINDGVYNVTEYQDEHPGGPIVLLNRAGKDATISFDQAAHSENAKEKVMPKHRIGTINRDSLMEEWQREEKQSAPSILVTVGILAVVLVLIYFLAA